MTTRVSTVAQRALLGGVAIFALVATGTETALAVTPVDGGSVGGSTVVIDASAGNQTDPHVSGDIAAYTDEGSGFSLIRFFGFFVTRLGPSARLSVIRTSSPT